MNRFIACGAAALLLLGATPAKPAPMPAFSATGTMTAGGESAGKSGTFQTSVQVMHRTNLWRIDVFKVAQLLPKGTITALIDQANGTFTVWTSSGNRFYRSKLALPHPKKTTKQSTPSSPWTNALNMLNSMTQYDVMNETFALVGHQQVNGRMASVFHITSQTQKHGGKLQQATADLALADDLSGIPIHLSVTAKGDATGSLQLDLSAISTLAPDAKLFTVPRGYKKTAQLFDVFAPHTP